MNMITLNPVSYPQKYRLATAGEASVRPVIKVAIRTVSPARGLILSIKGTQNNGHFRTIVIFKCVRYGEKE